MDPILFIILMLLLAGLLGSIPSAFLAGKCQGVDIRRYGSGNMGATNTMRVLGRRWGFLVLGVDVLKGYLASMFVCSVLGDWGAVLGGILAFITHCWNPWFKFKAVGKGVACALGSALFMLPVSILMGLVFFLVTVVLTRYISLASLAAAVSTVLMCFVFPMPIAYRLFAIVAASFIVFRHRENIKRIRAGTETRFTWGKKELDKEPDKEPDTESDKGSDTEFDHMN